MDGIELSDAADDDYLDSHLWKFKIRCNDLIPISISITTVTLTSWSLVQAAGFN
jgi:hypothetical protein